MRWNREEAKKVALCSRHIEPISPFLKCEICAQSAKSRAQSLNHVQRLVVYINTEIELGQNKRLAAQQYSYISMQALSATTEN